MRTYSGLGVSLLVAGLLSVVFLLLAFETWALFTGQQPITSYVRATAHSYPGWAFAVAVVLGILIGHVLWGGPVDRAAKSQG